MNWHGQASGSWESSKGIFRWQLFLRICESQLDRCPLILLFKRYIYLSVQNIGSESGHAYVYCVREDWSIMLEGSSSLKSFFLREFGLDDNLKFHWTVLIKNNYDDIVMHIGVIDFPIPYRPIISIRGFIRTFTERKKFESFDKRTISAFRRYHEYCEAFSHFWWVYYFSFRLSN